MSRVLAMVDALTRVPSSRGRNSASVPLALSCTGSMSKRALVSEEGNGMQLLSELVFPSMQQMRMSVSSLSRAIRPAQTPSVHSNARA